MKKQIRLKIILPLEQPDLYKAYGKEAGGGILMYGPPGCGKTLLARASAGQVKSKFMAVGIHEVLDMWIGQSERNLHELFEQGRNNRPCILFFDEVDALAASRTDMRQTSGRHLINQFLDELDGVRTSNEGLLVLAATNAPWHLDPAFRRPGRFDRILFVPPPDLEARECILRLLLKDKPAGEIDWEGLAKLTKDYSGADLKSAVDRAVETLLERAAESGEVEPILTKHLKTALKQVKPTTKEWFATAKNHALYSNQGGHYDEILEYLNLR
ncbi:MAG: ATP-binding protein [Verrucomicrobiota bacterium]